MQPTKQNMKVFHFSLVLLFFTWIGAVPLIEKQISRKGFHSKGLESRIFKGKEAYPGQFPWQAGIFYYNTSHPNNFWCGGSLINKQWILTAAHCILKSLSVSPIVFLGSTILMNDTSKSRKVFYNVKTYVHPNLSYYLNNNDLLEDLPLSTLKVPINYIALIKLPVKLDDTKYIRSIPLIDMKLSSGSKVYASGWGTTNKASYSNYLLFANMTILKSEICKQAPGYLGVQGEQQMRQQTSLFDSGGPLVYYNENGKPFLAGVAVSFAMNTAENDDDKKEITCKNNVTSEVFDFYFDVYQQKEWIEDTMKRHSN